MQLGMRIGKSFASKERVVTKCYIMYFFIMVERCVIFVMVEVGILLEKGIALMVIIGDND